MLAELIRRLELRPGARVLDLCTGSGILALTAAAHPDRRVVAVDISRRAVWAVRINARLNGVRVDARRGNLFQAVAGERYDLVVSNPPYLPSARDPSPHSAARAWEAGRDGRSFLDPICSRAGEHLNPGGILLLVHSEVCSEARTIEQLRSHDLQAEVVARHRGQLGPRLRKRAAELAGRGLLRDPAHEEMIFVRAERVVA